MPLPVRLLAAALALAAACPSAFASVRTPVNTRILHVAPMPGEYTLAQIRGPGVFVGARVNALGVDSTQVTAYVEIDGRTVFLSGLGASEAALGGVTNGGVGVTYAPELQGRSRASFGFAEPLRFERELRVYVRVEAGVPSRVFGDVVTGAPD